MNHDEGSGIVAGCLTGDCEVACSGFTGGIVLSSLLSTGATKANVFSVHDFSDGDRGVKFPNKLLAHHVPNFLRDAVN